MSDTKVGELVLICAACRACALVGCEQDDASRIEVAQWTCPSCGEVNALRIKGRFTDAMAHPSA